MKTRAVARYSIALLSLSLPICPGSTAAQTAEKDPAVVLRGDANAGEHETTTESISQQQSGRKRTTAPSPRTDGSVPERKAEQDPESARPDDAKVVSESPAKQPPEQETDTKPEQQTAPKPEPVPEPEPEPEQKAPVPAQAEAVEATEPKPTEPIRARPPIQRGGSLLGTAPPPSPPVAPALQQTSTTDATAAPAEKHYEPGELLLLSADMAEALSTARQLRAYQLRIKSRQRLDNLGLVLSVFRLPPGTSVPALQARLRTELPDLDLDANQRYRPLNTSAPGNRRRYGHRLITWPDPIGSCSSPFRIGILDTPVSDRHPALANAAVVRRSFVRGEAASPVHGTAVASLLVGAPDSPTPGLLPGSQLFAAEVFRQRGETTDTTTDSLLAALDWLAGRKVQAVNLSLGGERNRVFELALTRLLEHDIHLVAAAGNNGPGASPVFPAAQKGVIAVTAVDAAQRRYADANRGDYIDLAAPGVDIWAADGGALGRYHTGTSFAAPFVTAALLLANQHGIDLTETVKDLGPNGRDNQFGWGLLQVPIECRQQATRKVR